MQLAAEYEIDSDRRANGFTSASWQQPVRTRSKRDRERGAREKEKLGGEREREGISERNRERKVKVRKGETR